MDSPCEWIVGHDHRVDSLSAISVSLNRDRALLAASGATIARNCDGSLEEMAEWNDLDVVKSGTDLESIVSTGNSRFANQVVGFANYLIQRDGDSLAPLGFVAKLVEGY